MEKEVLLTEQEANVLIGLLDIAVKSDGLKVAQNALALVSKLQQAFTDAPEPQAPELMEEEELIDG